MDTLQVKRCHVAAKLPQRQSTEAAGYDLSSCEKKVVPAHGWALVSTGIAVRVPVNTYGRVAPRSGLSLKGICVGAGVIDRDYRSVVGVVLYNHGSMDFEVNVGDRIAQLILERIETPVVVEVDELDATERGMNGFGSSGLN
jgi:dUTP pyrophosphatase